MIEHKLDMAGLPSSLKYISLVESRLKYNARSGVGASGLWQFMVPTARYCGLNVDYWMDERLDPERSTEAAIYYFQDLYEQFEDWALVMAAYNAGPGRVRKAIRRAGTTDFEKVIGFLPRETRQYVPRFLAAKAYIEGNDLLSSISSPLTPDLWWTTEIYLDQKTRLSDVAEKLNLDLSLLQRLNTAWRHSYVSANDGKYFLRIPKRLLSEWWNVSEDERRSIIGLDKNKKPSSPIFAEGGYQDVKLPLRKHITIRKLAEDLGINPFRLALWNSIPVDKTLVAGQSMRIIIPDGFDCFSYVRQLYLLEQEFHAIPPKEVRKLELPLPSLESGAAIVQAKLMRKSSNPWSSGIPVESTVINTDVFVQILQRKKRRKFPFEHQMPTDHEEVAIYFSEN
jgi:membrane-bound lytic murein transglycosylase D